MGKLKDKADKRVWADDEIQWRTLQHNKQFSAKYKRGTSMR